MRIGRQIWIVLLFSLALVLSTSSFSQSLPAGDVAPYGTGGDGVLNAADYLVLQRIISGDLPMPSGTDLLVADVAPFGGSGPDGVLNTGDLLVLLRAIRGEITLPDIQTGPIDLSGPISQNTTLTQGMTYNVTSTVTVDPGVTLTIEAGARLEFAGNYIFQINGTLVVNGLPGNEVVFTSANASPARGDWVGIYVTASSTGTVIDHAQIRWATRGVEVTGATTATVSNSDIREFSSYGVDYEAGAGGLISGNTIDNVDDVGQGIRLNNTVAVTVDANVVSNTQHGVVVAGSSSPVVVSGNTLQDNGNGIYVSGTADPQVTGNTIINNGYGVRADAVYSNATPAPVVTGNDIYGNTAYDYYAERFGAAVNETITLDATGNWWGTTDPLAIAVQVYEYNDNTTYSPHVDYSGHLLGPINGPGVMSVTISELYFSPNNDTVKDTTQLQATLSEIADWTVTVEQAGVVYRSYSGTGNNISITWDGNDDTAQQVAEGAYRFYISATASTRTSLPVSTNHVTLDITVPIADIDDTYNGTILQNQLIAAVPGSANDATFADYQVEYGAGATPATWLPINGVLTIPVNNSTLDNWTVGTDDGMPPIANGPYTLRLTVNDKAGNTSSDTSQVTLDNLAAHSVTENMPGISPTLGESMQIDFTLNLPADVTLNVYSETDDSLVYTDTQSLLAGTNSLIWEGTDTLGALVAGGGYYYTLTATDGIRIGNYMPTHTPTITDLFLGTGGNQSFNTFMNDFFNRAATAPANGRAQLRLALATSPYVGQVILPDGDGIAMEAGTNRQFFWDGRIPGTADIYIGSFTAYLNFTTFGPNYVVVRSEAPVIKGPDAIGPSAPYVEVKADPYIVYLSYGQLMNVHYNIDRQSQVTIKLLPPGVTDFDDPSAVLVKDELQAAQDHTVEWQGLDSTGDGRDRTLPADGVYTLAIRAVATDSGASTLYKAVLSAYQ